MATTFTNETKNSTTITNVEKSDPNLSSQLLSIGDGFNLLIDSTYNLEIQSAVSGTTWSNEAKN